MAGGKASAARKAKGASDNILTLEELSDDKKKKYQSLVEDFHKQVETHIEEARAETEKMCKQIRNAYKVELFKLPKDQKSLLIEDLVQKTIEAKTQKTVNAVRESSIFQANLAKAKESVDSLVQKEVLKVEKSAKKKVRGGTSTVKKAKRKPSFNVLPPPTTDLRRSTRKRIPTDKSILGMETPMHGPGLAKGPLTSTAYSNRVRGLGRNGTVMQTPMGPNYTAAFADVSNVLPYITPKFDLATPLHKQPTVMRTAKADETIISLHGSPIYVGQTTRKGRRVKGAMGPPPTDNVEIGIGDGKKLVLPIDQDLNQEQEGDENTAPIDLDQAALERIKILKANLEKLIKNAEVDAENTQSTIL